MAWRVAKSLLKLREQINVMAPRRNKSADGTIGDAAHASRSSDHNPWVKDGKTGIVTALDITHDTVNGVHIGNIAEHMRVQRDPRIKYVICNARIFSSTTHAWQWRTYTGSNPHRSHFHTSVHSSKIHYDSEKAWHLPGGIVVPPDPDDPAMRMVLRRGAKGELVKEAQTILNITVSPPLIKVDGDFGPATEAQVRLFQGRNKLQIDGIIGARTWAAMDKIEQRHNGEEEGDALED